MMLGGIVAATANRKLRQQTTPRPAQRTFTSRSPGIQSSVDKNAPATNNGTASIKLQAWSTRAKVNGVCHVEGQLAAVHHVRVTKVTATAAATTPPTITHKKAN